MKQNKLYFLIVFLMCGFLVNAQNKPSQTAQNLSAVGHWFEAPANSNGDTIVFKTIKPALGPAEDPAYAWSEFEVNPNNTFDIKYWRWCPSGNYAYSGTWNSATSGKIIFDFGTNKCKCELQIISTNATELKAIIKETTN